MFVLSLLAGSIRGYTIICDVLYLTEKTIDYRGDYKIFDKSKNTIVIITRYYSVIEALTKPLHIIEYTGIDKTKRKVYNKA
jgi:hypothetical protein